MTSKAIQTQRANYHYMADAMRMLEWDLHQTVLRDMRLERAWEDLSNPGADTRVTDVATGLGFFHLGRFSEHYRRKFGCSPVETLRSALRA